MAHRGVNRLGVASCRAIAAAIVRRAEVRAAFHDLAWDLDLRLARIVARALTAAAGIYRNAARFWCIGTVLGQVPISGPFPDVADHIMDAVAVRREGRDRRRAFKAVLGLVLPRKWSLPSIGHMPPAGRKFIAPGERGAVQSSPRGKLPFGFCRQILAGPFGIGLRILVGHVNDRVIVEPADPAFRPKGMTPVRPFEEILPLAPIP
jgi:hypothetical protein